MEELVGRVKAAEVLGVKPNTVYIWSRTRKDFPAHRAGRLVKFLPSELREWSKDQQTQYIHNRERSTKSQRGPKPENVIAVG